MDDILKTRGITYLNVETWVLFAPYKNFWLRACTRPDSFAVWVSAVNQLLLQKLNQIIRIRLLTLLEMLVLSPNFQGGTNSRFALPPADAHAYLRNSKCIFEDLLPCCCYATKANSRTIRSRVSRPATAGKEADQVNCKLITACYQNSEPDSCALWVSYRQTNCHCKN